MITFLIIYIIGAAACAYHIYQLPVYERTQAKIIELLMLYQLIFYVGITSFLAFIGLTFLEDQVAMNTRWPTSPFEQELANVNFAYGVLGILSIWFRKLFWFAIVVGFSIWILGDAIHHQYDAYINHNYSDGNIGALFYTDLIIPILLIINMYFYIKTTPGVLTNK